MQDLTALISEFPQYASARNNRVQAIRTIEEDGLLVCKATDGTKSETANLDDIKRRSAAELAITDLITGINLLTDTSLGKFQPELFAIV